MSLAHRLAQLERRVSRYDPAEAPPVAQTLAEWEQRRDNRLAVELPNPWPRGVRGYFDGPPVASSMQEWAERARARVAHHAGGPQ